jgi:hypothetical protein
MDFLTHSSTRSHVAVVKDWDFRALSRTGADPLSESLAHRTGIEQSSFGDFDDYAELFILPESEDRLEQSTY